MAGRRMIWLFLGISVILISSTPAAAYLKGQIKLDYLHTSFTQDGAEETLDTRFQNYYLTLANDITPYLSYTANLRAFFYDEEYTGSGGMSTKATQEGFEPGLDLFLRNPLYSVDGGYRRLQGTTSRTGTEDADRSQDFGYARFNIAPFDLPSLLLQYTWNQDMAGSTVSQLLATSQYSIEYRGLSASFNVYFNRNVSELTGRFSSESTTDTLNVVYGLGYVRNFWNDRVSFSASYQGNYVETKNDITGKLAAGQLLFLERSDFPVAKGYFAQGTDENAVDISALPYPDNNTNAWPKLVDNEKNVPAEKGGVTIDLGSNGKLYYNIGIDLTFVQTVSDLLLCTNRPFSFNFPSELMQRPTNWIVQASNDPVGGKWGPGAPVELSNVTPDALHCGSDPIQGAFVGYRLKFNNPVSGRFFRVINLAIESGVPEPVFVTEYEAYNSIVVSRSGRITLDTTNTLLSQGISLGVSARLHPRLDISLGYYVNRSDQNLDGVLSSVGGLFTNIVGNKIEGNVELISNVQRNYSALATWRIHRLHSAEFRAQHSESFDNQNNYDFSANSYGISLSSLWLPAVTTTFSITRDETFNYGEKEATTNSFLLSMGLGLYQGVTMTTDFGYSMSDSFSGEETSSTTYYYINGSLYATLTPRLSGSLSYNLRWSDTGKVSASAKEGSLTLSYRPGRFINITGTSSVLFAGESNAYNNSIIIDWLFMKTVRLSFTYQNTYLDLGPVTRDYLSAYATWYVTRFMDLEVRYTLNRDQNDLRDKGPRESTYYSLGATLNCRLW